MKKQRKFKNYLKLGILLFGVSLLLWNCEKEEIIPLEKQAKYTTVKHHEALAFLQATSNKRLKKGNSIGLHFDTSLIHHESLTNTDKKLLYFLQQQSTKLFTVESY